MLRWPGGFDYSDPDREHPQGNPENRFPKSKAKATPKATPKAAKGGKAKGKGKPARAKCAPPQRGHSEMYSSSYSSISMVPVSFYCFMR